MNTINQESMRRMTSFTLAVLVTALSSASATADPLPIYGGPAYSSSAGGYLASEFRDNMPGLYPSAHVNDAGIAVANTHRLSSSGESLGLRAVRWSSLSTFVELGGGPDSRSSIAADRINAAGTVVGSVRVPDVLLPDETPQFRPARWGPSGTDATVLEHPYVHSASFYNGGTFVHDLNDTGTAVGKIWRSYLSPVGVPIDQGTRAARWNGTGTTLTELGHLGTDPDGYTQGQALAINPAGNIVGVVHKYDTAGNYFGYVAVRWDPSSTAATELGTLGTVANDPFFAPDGYTESQAFAINSAGTAVGYANVYDDAGQLLRQNAPVRWDPSGHATALGSLDGNYASVVWSPATLNDAGMAVGWSDKGGPGQSLGSRAVRWDADSTEATELGNLGTEPTGFAFSEAAAVNAAGVAVGFAERYTATGVSMGKRAVYWGEDTLAIDLNTLIDPSSGWVLNQALEISDTGWIVGSGLFDPDGAGGELAWPRHFLMHVPATVPEPATGLTIAMGAFALLRRGRRDGARATAPRSPIRRKGGVKNPSSVVVFAATACIAGGAPISLGAELVKLTPSDATANQAFATSVSVSGNTAIIGSWADHSAGDFAGSVYLYDVTTGQQLTKLFASDAQRHDGFGVAVAIDGGTAIVGASGDDLALGSAYLFGATTGAQLFKLTASDPVANQVFGSSVAISGNTALVGAPRNDDFGLRSAYLFDVARGQELFKLTPTDVFSQFGGFFGNSVAVSGNNAIIGAPGDDEAGSNSGAVYVFDVTTGQQRFKLTGFDASGGESLGHSVAIYGNIAIVGAPGDDHAGAGSGSAYLFDVITGQELGRFTASDAAAEAGFGASVAMNGDFAIIGSPTLDHSSFESSGAVYLFDMQTREELMKLIASGAGAYYDMGRSVSISGDQVLVGAPGATPYGAAYVFSTTVPEPSAGLMTVLGVASLLRRRHRGTFMHAGDRAR